MFLLMAKKANLLLHKYKVKRFPVPVEAIECIIINEGIGIKATKYLQRAVFFNNVIYVGTTRENSCLREYLVHEVGHKYHAGNTALVSNNFTDKNEAQARAFTAYFLMPVGVFETHLRHYETDYALGEIFGVKQKLVAYRKKLSKALLESGCYNQVRYIFFS